MPFKRQNSEYVLPTEAHVKEEQTGVIFTSSTFTKCGLRVVLAWFGFIRQYFSAYVLTENVWSSEMVSETDCWPSEMGVNN